MHCDVDLRSRRMWAASYRLTRLIMNEDSHVPRGPDTGRERVLTQRRGNGDDGAGGGCARARAPMLLRPLHLVWWLGWVSLGGGVSAGDPGGCGGRAFLVRSHHASTRSHCPSPPSLRPARPPSSRPYDGIVTPLRLRLLSYWSRPPAKFGEDSIVGT